MAKKKAESTIEKQIDEHNDEIERLEQEKDNLLSVERQARLQELEVKKDGIREELRDARKEYEARANKQAKSYKVHEKNIDTTKEANRKLHMVELALRQVEHAINNA